MGTATGGAGGRARGMWEAVAPAWGAAADATDARVAAVTERMLARAAPAAGERVLELACGAGGTGLAAAEIVGPDGHVLMTDAVAAMTAIAADRARSRGLANADARVCDLEAIDLPGAAFDVVLCREGLMFAADPVAAAAGIRRVLRPGGRAAVAVWGPRERNPWLGLVFDTASAHLGAPIPPPGIPGPFALDDAERLEGVLRAGGLTGVRVEEVDVPVVAGSADEWWDRATALAGPLAVRLSVMPAGDREALRARAREAARPYATGEGLRMPGVSLVACGRAG